MTTEEAIEILDNEYRRIELQIIFLKGTIKENTESFRYRIDVKESLKTAISALKEIQLYKDNKLCLVPEDVYSRQCSELDAYKEIGTVEECREAVEKQTQKRCAIDSCPDHTHYKCPSCGKIQKTKYNDSTFGCILNNCSNCGQALINEDLEGREDEEN